MWSFFESFNDPRWGHERRFLCIFLPIILLLTGASLAVLLWEKSLPTPEFPEGISAASSGLSIPAPPIKPGLMATEKPTTTSEPIIPSPPADLSRGEIALDKGDLTSARIFLSRALTRTETKAQAYNALGMLEVLEKNPEEAVTNFTEAIALDDRNPGYFYNRSEILRRAGRHKEALADLRKANSLASANPLYSNKILLARLEGGDSEAVFREMKTNLELNLSACQSDWLAGAAAIEMESGNTHQSLEFLRMLRPLIPAPAFQMIVNDSFFDRYREKAELSRLISSEPAP